MKSIYKITYLPTGRVYVGRTKKTNTIEVKEFGFMAHERFAEHLTALYRGDHFNVNLTAIWDGDPYKFKFEIICRVVNAGAKQVEDEYIKEYNEKPEGVFNIVKQSKRPSHIPKDIQEKIIKKIKSGMLGKDIAKKYGVSTASVSLLKTGIRGTRAVLNHRMHIQYLKCAKNLVRHSGVGRGSFRSYEGRINCNATLRAQGLSKTFNSSFRGWLNKQGIF